MKIFSFVLRLIGGLGIAYGIGMILIWLVMWRGYTLEREIVGVILVSLLGGMILNQIGNRLHKRGYVK